MDKLTDLELIEAIAKIDGFDYTIRLDSVCPGDPTDVIKHKLTDVYNPLTDKALLLDLIMKYEVQLSHHDNFTDVRIYGDPEDNPVAWIKFDKDSDHFSRYVLLCILGASNG